MQGREGSIWACIRSRRISFDWICQASRLLNLPPAWLLAVRRCFCLLDCEGLSLLSVRSGSEWVILALAWLVDLLDLQQQVA